MPKTDWKRRVSELEEQVRITKEKAELQELIDKKESKKTKKAAAPKKKAIAPKTAPMKAGAKKPMMMIMMPDGTVVPMTVGKPIAGKKQLALGAPKVIEP